MKKGMNKKQTEARLEMLKKKSEQAKNQPREHGRFKPTQVEEYHKELLASKSFFNFCPYCGKKLS